MSELPPCVIFEDEHLLVVNKPAGMNTHSPSPFAGEGIYEWLRHREPRWANLAIMHRLDKETSGVMVFGKTSLANKSLTEQFTQHTIQKKYLLTTDGTVKADSFTVVSSIVRVGEKYVSRPLHAGGERAETHFRVIERSGDPSRTNSKFNRPLTTVEARPVTGRTHQIRVHAAAEGFPIIGDELYGGTPNFRVYLHAAELKLKHPETGAEMVFEAPEDPLNTRWALRDALINPRETNAYRLIHGAADHCQAWHLDRLGDYMLSERSGSTPSGGDLRELRTKYGLRSFVYLKSRTQPPRRVILSDAPKSDYDKPPVETFAVRENGVDFKLSFAESGSVGIFLDQRDNRRRFLTNYVAADFTLFPNGAAGAEVLNTFAYTCGFSVCAAKAGARTTSLDLSKKYLEWGKQNFALNGLDATAHDFIFGDAFDWMKRLAKKGRAFDVIVLDPPTFSQSKEGGAFQVEKDYGRLVETALPLLKPGGVLLASTNAARWEPEKFMETVTAAVKSVKRKILRQHYVPQPPDFPVHRDEPAYLKTVWLKIT